MSVNRWVRVGCAALMIAAMSVFISGCSDDEGDETSITGDSNLRVVNQMGQTIEVKFDGDFIGEVADDSNRSWSVPSGSHEVTVETKDPLIPQTNTRTYTFVRSGTTQITVTSGTF